MLHINRSNVNNLKKVETNYQHNNRYFVLRNISLI